MRAFLFVMLLAIMGSTALVIRNRSVLKRQSRQASSDDCKCVLYNQCHSNYTVNKFGVTLINIRISGPCKHYLEVCCKPEDLIKGNETSSDVSNNTSSDVSSSNIPLLESSTDSSTPNPPSTDSPLPCSALPSSQLPDSSVTESPALSSLSNDSAERNPLIDTPLSSLPSSSSSLPESSITDKASPSSSSSGNPPATPSATDSLSPSSSLSGSPSSIPSSGDPSISSNTQLPPSPTLDSLESSSSADDASSSSPLPSSPIPPTGNLASSSPSTESPSSSSLLPNSPNTSSNNSVAESLNEDPNILRSPPKPIAQERYKSPGCGIRNADGVGFRIVGAQDHEAQFAEFPWVVALLREEETFVCGASLIHPSVVLTSAHCVNGLPIENLVARAGEWDRATTREVLPHQDRGVAEVIEHEEFFSAAVLNDIALLILKEPFNLTASVDTICLPTQDYDFDLSQCVASGWGKENFNSEKEQVILKKVNLPVVPFNTCESILRTTRLGNLFELHDSFLCAGGKKGQDTCTGDGGSPLMCPMKSNPHRYEQAGMVAWGIGCGDMVPGVYASVARFRNWIDTKLSQKGIKISQMFLDIRSSVPSS